MSTLSIALIVVIATICIPLIFILIHKKSRKKKDKALLNRFIEEGSKLGLSFSSQEMLRSKIIGLDGATQTMLVFDFNNDENIRCINMSEVKTCSIEKSHDSIVIGMEKQAKPESHLRSIDLKFTFKNEVDPISVSFYDSNVNSIYEMAELESKAKAWEVLLSKMLFKELKIRV
jgi:hypothetical protein